LKLRKKQQKKAKYRNSVKDKAIMGGGKN